MDPPYLSKYYCFVVVLVIGFVFNNFDMYDVGELIRNSPNLSEVNGSILKSCMLQFKIWGSFVNHVLC